MAWYKVKVYENDKFLVAQLFECDSEEQALKGIRRCFGIEDVYEYKVEEIKNFKW